VSKGRLSLTLRADDVVIVHRPDDPLRLYVNEVSGSEKSAWVAIDGKGFVVQEVTIAPDLDPLVFGEIEVRCTNVHASRVTIVIEAPKEWRIEKLAADRV